MTSGQLTNVGEGTEKGAHSLLHYNGLGPSGDCDHQWSSLKTTNSRRDNSSNSCWQRGHPEVSWGLAGSLEHKCHESGRRLRYSLNVFWRNCKPGTHDGSQLYPAEFEALIWAGPSQTLVVTFFSWKESMSWINTIAKEQNPSALCPGDYFIQTGVFGGASHSSGL